MSSFRVGLIGFGSIGATLADLVARDPDLREVGLIALVRQGRQAPLDTVHSAEVLCARLPDLVIECAGHDAVSELVPQTLRAGIDTVVASIGALADDGLHDGLVAAAQSGGGQLILPAGAIGGIDLMSALKPSGIASVVYEGRKPPQAWIGSPAEEVCDLENLTAAEVFFRGTARDAALRYPKNANVAATLALAGIGFDATEVRLVADPDAPGNTHRYTVTSGGADYRVEITGKPSPDNPRTSMATVYSLLREIRNRASPVAI